METKNVDQISIFNVTRIIHLFTHLEIIRPETGSSTNVETGMLFAILLRNIALAIEIASSRSFLENILAIVTMEMMV